MKRGSKLRSQERLPPVRALHSQKTPGAGKDLTRTAANADADPKPGRKRAREPGRRLWQRIWKEHCEVP